MKQIHIKISSSESASISLPENLEPKRIEVLERNLSDIGFSCVQGFKRIHVKRRHFESDAIKSQIETVCRKVLGDQYV